MMEAYFQRRADEGNINITLIVHSLIGSKYKCIPMPYQYFECRAKDIEGGKTIY